MGGGSAAGGRQEGGRREEAGRPSAPCCCKFITFAPVPPPPLAASLPACLQATTTGTSCDTQYFTKTEDRPIVKERVEYVQEHRPVEKEFVVGAYA